MEGSSSSSLTHTNFSEISPAFIGKRYCSSCIPQKFLFLISRIYLPQTKWGRLDTLLQIIFKSFDPEAVINLRSKEMPNKSSHCPLMCSGHTWLKSITSKNLVPVPTILWLMYSEPHRIRKPLCHVFLPTSCTFFPYWIQLEATVGTFTRAWKIY